MSRTIFIVRRSVNPLPHAAELAAGTSLLGVLALAMLLGHNLAITVAAYRGWTPVNTVCRFRSRVHRPAKAVASFARRTTGCSRATAPLRPAPNDQYS
jgi:hypothetical protein